MESEYNESTDDESTEEETIQRRGRGRPRKVSGRGRGRPRTVRAETQRPRATRPGSRASKRKQPADDALAALEERRRDIERRVDALSPTEMRETLIRVVEENPEYLFAILGSSNKEPQQPEGPGPSQSQPSWCVCTFCKEMPTQRERLCCQKDPESCISRLPDFRVLMLDEAVLAVARLYRQDILAMPEDEDRNRANRHTAYRQFVLWHHGRLGAGDRRVIPSCCVWRIREKFPDPLGHYVGFKNDPLQ